MKIATAPVNWNSPDVPEYRAMDTLPSASERDAGGGILRHGMGDEHAKGSRAAGP